MKRLINILTILAITAGMLAATPARSVKALTRVVSNTDDSGAGSLRQALLDANNGDVIDLTGISGTITLLSQLTVTDEVTINGPGASNLTVSGNNAVRVLGIDSGMTVTIRDLTVADGRVVDLDGAGIENSGHLTLENMIINNNHAVKGASDYLRGGGIHNNDGASLTVKNSTISNNSAVQNGGGIHSSFNSVIILTDVIISSNSLSFDGSSGGGLSIREGSTATLERVSITNNSAKYNGGGLFSYTSIAITDSLIADNTLDTEGVLGGGAYFVGPETFTLKNVTVSGNSVSHAINNASGGGLGIDQGTLNLNNVTLTDNTADGDGGGIFVTPGATVNFKNTIIASNISTDNSAEDCYGSLNSQGHNLIQVPTDCTIDGSIIGVLVSLDAKLSTLADNGGPTLTHALMFNSPAVDAGDNATCELKDQRGLNRPQGTTCDMGAYELRKDRIVYRSIGAQDGQLLESGENTNVGGWYDASSPYLALGDDTAGKQYRSILSFGTATLPDNAVITKVTLKVRRQGIVGGGNPVTLFQGFMLDIRRGAFGNANLQATDWQATANKTVGPLNTPISAGWYVFDLTSARAYINKLATGAGVTQIRMRFELDDNNNALANYLSLYSGNIGAASRPQLIVEYYVP